MVSSKIVDPSAASPVDIPVIDISARDAPNQLLNAAAKFGFVFVENNEAGIDARQISHMFDLSRDLFQSPIEIKEACSINSNKSGKNKGWLSMHTEKLDPVTQKRGDFKEAFNIGEYKGDAAQQPLPDPLAPHEKAIGDFVSSCHTLCNEILRLFAVALEIPPDWFTSRHDRTKGPSGSVMRLLYYPAMAGMEEVEDGIDIRAGAHSDYGSVTLLFQLPGQPGLEILTPQGTWASVPVDPSAKKDAHDSLANGNGHVPRTLPILVNIGDLLSYWTNNLLKSTVHRVVFPTDAQKGGEDRYSMAYFCHPLDDAELVSVPSKLVEEYGAREGTAVRHGKHTLTARDHLNERLAATYGIGSGPQESKSD
ncbi:hypothetical protein LTR66_003240 [Elasticomyces elasticus]|nr:hypothetical protein LTR28_008559 [Elasticomyces elasticus]KAK4997303.1 hypothetical protein LTR66_003240 [Elasticomyces elasticus]